MGAITAKRSKLILDEYESVKKNALRSISELQRDLNAVRLFSLFAFQEMLAGGDIDADDLAHIETEFNDNFPLITGLAPMLMEIAALNDDPTPEGIQSAVDAMITSNDLASALESYKQRFEI